MVWLFHRGGQALRLETRWDTASGEFLLVLRQPDGSQQVEHFSDVAAFRNRLDALENHLQAEYWTLAGSPVFLRDGWKVT